MRRQNVKKGVRCLGPERRESGTKMEIIARVHSDYGEKFGIPRQSGLADSQERIVFEKEYRSEDAVRGIESYSHLWVLWQFSEVRGRRFQATVRPPRLGGNERRGVFATRSPFRPNRIGLSCVQLERVEYGCKDSPVLIIRGGDMMDGTPVLDIKPYLPYVDAHPEALGGFSFDQVRVLRVHFPDELLQRFETEKRHALLEILAQDPRPSYQEDPDRIYGMLYAGRNVRFRVAGSDLYVESVENL